MIQPTNGKGTRMQHARMLSAGALSNGTYILGAKGSGKSTLEAELAWHHYLCGIGQILIDPIGVGLTDTFLWKLLRFLRNMQFSSHARYLERIKYVNIVAKDYIVPFPLIYKTGAERSLLEIAERTCTPSLSAVRGCSMRRCRAGRPSITWAVRPQSFLQRLTIP